MIWIFITLAANFCWSLVNLGDKFLISHKLKSAYAYLILLSWTGLFSLLIIPFIDFFILETRLLFWLILAGLLYFLGNVFYLQSAKIEEITRINVWFNLIPLFSL